MLRGRNSAGMCPRGSRPVWPLLSSPSSEEALTPPALEPTSPRATLRPGDVPQGGVCWRVLGGRAAKWGDSRSKGAGDTG